MSENFESGLNELYTRATAAHADGAGFPMASMIAVARRNRRRRTAAVAVATAAAVVGVGLGGAAAVRNLGDGEGVAPPAATPTVTGTVLEPTCGTAIEDLKVGQYEAVSFSAGLSSATVAAGVPLRAWVTMAINPTEGLTPGFDWGIDQYPSDVAFIISEDGVVVGSGYGGFTGEPLTDEDTGLWANVSLNACDAAGAIHTDPLGPGSYVLHPAVKLVFDEGGAAFLAAEPLPFTVTPDALATPETPAPDVPTADITHEVSAQFTDGEPLADGDYIANVVAIDAAAGTVDADLMVWYSGQAAQDYVAANIPGGEVVNDYYLANGVEQATTLPLAPDVSVYEWCFGEGDTPDLTHLVRTVPEWASAPHYDRAEAHLECAAGQLLDRGDLYWFRVTDGVITAVTGQFVP